jgi:hypothetical protein
MKTRRSVRAKMHFEIEGLLAGGSLFLFGISLAAVILLHIPEPNEKYIMLMLGALIGLVKDTFARYFNSTKGAQEQRQASQRVMDRLAANANTTPPTGTASVTPGQGVEVTSLEDPAPPAAGKR